MGGPNNLDEVEVFLKNMFNDPCILNIKNSFFRKIIASIIVFFRKNEAKKNYSAIGSKSPIVGITSELVENIRKEYSDIDVDFAMNYTPPFCKDVLEKYKNEKYDEIILFALYPHYSITTTKSSIDDAKEALNDYFKDAKVKIINPFFDDKNYNDTILDLILKKVENFKKDELKEISLIFSAHSLPKKIIENGDSYEEHIKKHIEILKDMLLQEKIEFKEILLAYQSRLGPVEWLEPNLGDVLQNLDSKKALIFPISFCIDNSETIFELCIEYKEVASKIGFKFYDVVPCPNSSKKFINFIINKIKD